VPVLDTPELAIHYETAGRGRTPMLLVHGNFASWRWWKPILERPPKGFTIYAPTLRGFGATRATERARSVDVLAADVRAFARGLGLERFHLVGHSLGGAVSLQYALTWPDTLRSLALIAPAAGDGLEAMRSRSDVLGFVMRWADPIWSTARIALLHAMRWERFLGTHRGRLAHALARMMPSADPAVIDFDALLADAVAIDELVVVDTYEALRRWDVRDRLAKLEVPVRILAGRRDVLVSVESLDVLGRALPHARLEVWEDVGHSPQLEKPTELAAWLAHVRPPLSARMRDAVRRLTSRIRRLLGT
jgi:pimeloyl-ACP methyl ester carboxylesterase